MKRDSIEHEIKLVLASGASLTILFFSDREQRWIHAYDYVGDKAPGAVPDIANDVRLTAGYEGGVLAPQIVLSMHVIVPARLGQRYFAGVDISPGAKTYLEFTYERAGASGDTLGAYILVEICKGARDRVRLDHGPGLMQPIEFPFPVPDRVAAEHGKLHVPFLTNAGSINHFELPWSTVR